MLKLIPKALVLLVMASLLSGCSLGSLFDKQARQYNPADLMADFHDNVVYLNQYDKNMIFAASEADSDIFFENYHAFLAIANESMAQAEKMAELMEQGSTNAALDPLIRAAYAKKRSSWLYYIPIFGSLVKAKHQSIETAREGIYTGLQDMYSGDRDRILEYHGLSSVSDLENASDSTIERLSRDPEVGGLIDWTKVVTDLGKTAVETVVEASQAVTGGENPITPSGYAENVVKQLVTKRELDSVGKADIIVKNSNTTTTGDKKKVFLAINESVGSLAGAIDDDAIGSSWDALEETTQDQIADAIFTKAQTDGPLMVALAVEDAPEATIELPEGEWDVTTSDSTEEVALIEDLEVTNGEDQTIDVASFGLNDVTSVNLNNWQKNLEEQTQAEIDASQFGLNEYEPPPQVEETEEVVGEEVVEEETNVGSNLSDVAGTYRLIEIIGEGYRKDTALLMYPDAHLVLNADGTGQYNLSSDYVADMNYVYEGSTVTIYFSEDQTGQGMEFKKEGNLLTTIPAMQGLAINIWEKM